MSDFEPLDDAACAGAKAANKAVKEVTGKSIVSHCKSAAKGLRNIVLQKAGEKASKDSADEVLFRQRSALSSSSTASTLSNICWMMAQWSAMAADPSVVAELEGLAR